ncbi:DNRLRE domain-containing protein, partial [Dyadobacter sp. CY261]|uniref:DNRLRE domain-containing protein n=1 Tax=Dyadobacter sp. CY261 TaxID=2907203 RepID=UPI001F2BC7FC
CGVVGNCLVNKVKLVFRSPGDCCMDRLNGAKLQGSNNGGSSWTDIYSFSANGTGSYQEFTFSNSNTYASLRFVASSTGWGELTELEFYNGTTKLTGTAFGTGNYGLAFDNSLTTKWEGSSVGSSNVAGLNLTGCGSGVLNPPLVEKTSGNTACVASNHVVQLTASNCSGSITWFRSGTQVGTGTTLNTNVPGSYTARCTVGSQTSESAVFNVAETSGCGVLNPPTIQMTSGTTACVATNQLVQLTASNCTGSITWFRSGTQVGTGTTLNTNVPGNYTARCTSGSQTSESAVFNVGQTSGCGQPTITPSFSIWKAGVSGVRTKIKDLVNGDQIQLSSFGGGQANWFMEVPGQVTNSGGANYYDKVLISLTRPNATTEGWGPDPVGGGDGGPYGVHGRDGGSTPIVGTYQLSGKVYNGSTEIGSRNISFSIVNPCSPVSITASQAKDARVSENASSTNYGQTGELAISRWSYDNQDATLRAYIDFSELQNIPQGATITSATLNLFGISSTNATQTFGNSGFVQGTTLAEIWVKRVTSPWQETGVNWDNKPSVSPSNWVSLGPPSSQWNFNASVSVAQLVQDMVNLPASSRYGFALELKDEARYRSMVFASKDASDASRRPKLTITYTTCPGSGI